MVLPKEGSLLRIFISESDKHEDMLFTNGLFGKRGNKDWREQQFYTGWKDLTLIAGFTARRFYVYRRSADRCRNR